MRDHEAQPHRHRSPGPALSAVADRLRQARRRAARVAYAIAVTSPLLTEQDRQRVVDRNARP